MESADNHPGSQKVISSKPEASHQERSGEPTTAMLSASVAAANQSDNDTVAVIKEPRTLDGDQGVDEAGELPMDTSLSKEESKKEPDPQNNTTPLNVQEGETPFRVALHHVSKCVYVSVCVQVCTCVCECVWVLLDRAAR